MIYVLFCILASALIVFVFRLAGGRDVALLPMIAVNYATCVVCGLFFVPDYLTALTTGPSAWRPMALFHGVLFISLFFLIGRAAQRIGVAYTAMITRVSVIFPTLLSVLVYQERLDWAGGVGVVAALGAIVLLHLKYLGRNATDEGPALPVLLTFSVILFLGTGLADALFKIVDHEFAGQVGDAVYTITLFLTAAVSGLGAVAVQVIRGRLRLAWRQVFWGVALGIPNYFSIIFLFWSLETVPGAVFFPVNHVGVLVLVSLVGVAYFGERFRPSTWLGLLLACLAIVLLSWQELSRTWG